VTTNEPEGAVKAKDVMTTGVATIRPGATSREVAELMLERRISGVPVVADDGRVLGMISESDLMRRPESGTERHISWWSSLLASTENRATAYIKSHGVRASDVMTRYVVSVAEETSLEEVADLFEKFRIKRVPVLRDGRLVGIVSRADLLQGLVRQTACPATTDDQAIRKNVAAAISEAGIDPILLRIEVSGGVAHLQGAVESDVERQAARVAAEHVVGIRNVNDEISVLPPSVRAVLWVE
jgi:CBS domain-containing protein